MKHFKLAFIIAFLILSACKTKKTATSNWTMDSCIELAVDSSDYIRAYGNGTSFKESMAKRESLLKARYNICYIIKKATIEAIKGQKNGDSIPPYLNGIMNPPCFLLKTNVYDLSNGMCQVYCCLQTKITKEKLCNNIIDSLNSNGCTTIDKNLFVKIFFEEIEKSKKMMEKQL